jgi:menaquinone-dependent protoporphyrinogen oxidase
MMSVCIVYATATGSTEKCAKALAEKFGEPCTLVNIKKDRMPALESFDKIVVGSPIRAGRINGKIKKFCLRNEALLQKKKTALFICCADKDNPMAYFKANFSETLLARCFAALPLGGEMSLEKAGWFDRLFIKMALRLSKKKGIPLPMISETAVSELAKKIKEA